MRYDSSPWSAVSMWGVILITMIVVLILAGGGSNAAEARWFFGLLAIFPIGMILVQQRRTFVFDRVSSTLKWTTQGVFGRTYNEIPFNDVSVAVQSVPTRYSGMNYRVMLTFPSGKMPMTQWNTGEAPMRQLEREVLSVLGGRAIRDGDQ